MRTPRPRGFTLVELLVVIGIIAVLISILLPALNRARVHAKRIECASLMRQVGMAARQYAGDNHDCLPPFRADDNGGNLSDSVFNYLYTLDDKVNSANPVNMGAGIGRLIATGYLGRVNPSTAPEWQANFSRLQKKYGLCPAADDAALSLGDWYKSFYYFQPHLAIRNGKNTRWWPKLTPYGKPPKHAMNATTGFATDPQHVFTWQMALMSDPIYETAHATHAAGKARSWNLLFADGSVKVVSVPPDTNRAGGKWGRMLDLLGYLEATADNQASGPPSNTYNWMPIDP